LIKKRVIAIIFRDVPGFILINGAAFGQSFLFIALGFCGIFSSSFILRAGVVATPARPRYDII
jgi:hypothetical protein